MNINYNFLTKILKYFILGVVGLVVLFLLYVTIISIDLPLTKGIVINKYIDPYHEYQTVESYRRYDTVYYKDSKGDRKSKSVYDHTDNYYYLNYDYIDYMVVIQNNKKTEKNYIFWKVKYYQTTTYYVTKLVYDSIQSNNEMMYDNKIYNGQILDWNNEKILLNITRSY